MAESNSLVVGEILDYGLIPAINAAWSNPKIVEDDDPRIWEDPLPNVVQLSWTKVDIGFDGLNATVGETNQAYEFSILYFFPMPQAMGTGENKISRVKERLASLLIAQVQTGPGFAQRPDGSYVANMPLLHEVDSREKGKRWDGVGYMTLSFSCQVGRAHHV